MRGGAGDPRLLLVLALLLGLVGMHALVTPPAAGPPEPAPSVSTSVSPSVSDAGHPGHPGHGTHGAAAPSGSSGHGDHEPGGHGAAHLLHLCLAVLAAAGMLLLVSRLVPGLPVPWTSDRLLRRWSRGAPVARPPPVPRRLAQLCVWRN